MIAGTITDVGRNDQDKAGLMRVGRLAGCVGQPDFATAWVWHRSGCGVGVELTDRCVSSELIPCLALGWIHAVGGSELGSKSEFEFAGVPQPQGLIDNSAAIEIGMHGDIGVHAGEEVGVERGGDFGATAGRKASRHAHSIPDTVPVTLTDTQPVIVEGPENGPFLGTLPIPCPANVTNCRNAATTRPCLPVHRCSDWRATAQP